MPLAYCSTRYLFDEEIKHPSALQSEPEFGNIKKPCVGIFKQNMGLGTE
jgi:hypothetical protein